MLKSLCESETTRKLYGTAGREFLDQSQGAVQRTIKMLNEVLAGHPHMTKHQDADAADKNLSSSQQSLERHSPVDGSPATFLLDKQAGLER